MLLLKEYFQVHEKYSSFYLSFSLTMPSPLHVTR